MQVRGRACLERAFGINLFITPVYSRYGRQSTGTDTVSLTPNPATMVSLGFGCAMSMHIWRLYGVIATSFGLSSGFRCISWTSSSQVRQTLAHSPSRLCFEYSSSVASAIQRTKTLADLMYLPILIEQYECCKNALPSLQPLPCLLMPAEGTVRRFKDGNYQ